MTALRPLATSTRAGACERGATQTSSATVRFLAGQGSPVAPCLYRVLHFLIASDVGIALRASEGTITLNHRVCVAGWVVCDTVESAIGARPGVSGPHAEVWPVLNVWAESVKYGFSRLNVSLIVEADGLLCFGITVNGGFCDVGAILDRKSVV